jgi:arylformamidase
VRIHDISVAISPERTPVFPGDPRVRVRPVARISHGDPLDLSLLSLGSHTATHIDAPSHFLAGAATVDAVPLDACLGPAQVCGVEAGSVITPGDLEAAGLLPGTVRLLLKTRNSALWRTPQFDGSYLALGPDAATWLVRRGIRLVGIDYLSIEPYGAQEFPVHKTLLGAGVVILEGLDLDAVSPGQYTLVCFPLKITGCDGAPVRAALIEPALEMPPLQDGAA